MRTNIMRTNLLWLGPALAALVAVAACAPTPGGSGGMGTGTQTTGTETGTGSGGTDGGTSGGNSGGGGGGTVDDGPWPVVISAGTVELDRGRKYCGGPSPVMLGTVTVSVAHGPVTVKLFWRPAEGGYTYATTTVEFTGTGAQSKEVSAGWGRTWGTSGTVRISYADLVPGPGQHASQYIPPTPLDINYQVPACTRPDLTVKIVVSPVPQKCPHGQAMAHAVVTLGSELTSDTSGFTATLVWQHPTNPTTKAVEFSFVPGGPKVVTLPIVWSGLQAPRTYAANVQVLVERPGDDHHPHRYFAPEVKFTTTCVN